MPFTYLTVFTRIRRCNKDFHVFLPLESYVNNVFCLLSPIWRQMALWLLWLLSWRPLARCCQLEDDKWWRRWGAGAAWSAASAASGRSASPETGRPEKHNVYATIAIQDRFSSLSTVYQSLTFLDYNYFKAS